MAGLAAHKARGFDDGSYSNMAQVIKNCHVVWVNKNFIWHVLCETIGIHGPITEFYTQTIVLFVFCIGLVE